MPDDQMTTKEEKGLRPVESSELARVEGGAVDMFLKIDGLRGEAADGGHEDEIDVLSWS